MAASLEDRVLGSLMGLAIADAVGTTVESMPPGSFKKVTDMEGGGKFSLQPGQVREQAHHSAHLAYFDDFCFHYSVD